jgi:hypothetical protein
MFSVEETIIAFIGFVKRYFRTILYIIFRPARLIDRIETKKTEVFSSPAVFFIISLFLYSCLSDEFNSEVILRVEPDTLKII